MPRKTRLVISGDAPKYRPNYRRGDAISCVRYESEDEEESTITTETHSKQCATVKETATFRLITDVVASNKSRKRSRRIHFGEDASLTAPALYADVDTQSDALDDNNIDVNDTPPDYVYFSDDDGATRDGNVFTPVDLGTNDNDDDDVLEPAIVSNSPFHFLHRAKCVSDKRCAFLEAILR